MNKKNILFYTLISIFILTVLFTFLGLAKIISIDDFYLKGLFAAFIIELAGSVYSIARKGNLLDEPIQTQQKTDTKLSATANLKLHIWGDHRAPERISSNNIFRWYYLQNLFRGVSESGEVIQETIFTTLFVSFDKDVEISTVKVSSPDMALPIYEVKDFNQRYAIICFSEQVKAGTLEVNISL